MGRQFHAEREKYLSSHKEIFHCSAVDDYLNWSVGIFVVVVVLKE